MRTFTYIHLLAYLHAALQNYSRLPYNLYCVGGDVKHCTIQSSRITDYHNNEAFLLVKCIRRWRR